ncbi:MAG: efflux RND transporter periplasmic adaptor subunit [Chitinophagaceae bacterium]
MKNFYASLHAILLVFAYSCTTAHHEEIKEAHYEVTTPLIKDTSIIKEYVCQIKSIQHIELRALEKGYLQKIFVDEGQYVKQGQVLFQITPTIYQAETSKAEAEANFADIEYQNTKMLYDSNIVSKNELALAKAKLTKAQAEVQLAKTHLGFTVIKAPFSGFIDKFNARLGSLLDEGELLTTLSDNDKLWVYFNVPEAEYLDFKAKSAQTNRSQVQIRLANNQIFPHPGVIETIIADFNNETGNIAFRATFPNPDHLLRHGETGNILMKADVKNAMIIPQQATFEVLDKKFVYVVLPDGTLESRQITIGTELAHLYVVTEGLKADDLILLEGQRKVKNGEKIAFNKVDPSKVIEGLQQLHVE